MQLNHTVDAEQAQQMARQNAVGERYFSHELVATFTSSLSADHKKKIQTNVENAAFFSTFFEKSPLSITVNGQTLLRTSKAYPSGSSPQRVWS